MSFQHTPVLLEELLSFVPTSAKTAVDFTLGGANHSLALLQRCRDVFLFGVDRDSDAILASKQKLSTFENRVEFIHDSFAHAGNKLISRGVKADFIFADLGVSSHQLSTSHRGFSFRQEGPLDMRMNSDDPISAADIVNTYTEQELGRIIRTLGEEKFAQRIARFIVTYRKEKRFTTTQELSDCILEAIPKKFQFKKIHASTKTFQALRMEVNGELEELDNLIDNAMALLNPKGRIAIITFHSLEDRPVKQAFKRWHDPCTCAKDLPVCICKRKPEGKLITRKAVKASSTEIETNNRSRSARLRVLEKL